MKRLVILFAILIALTIIGVAAYFAYQYAVHSPYRISSVEAKNLLQTEQIDLVLDVRTDLERSTLEFYPGSVHIQSADLETRMPKQYPDKNIRILAYCNTGHRARMATDTLHKLGYTNVRYISSTYTSLQ